MAEKTNGKKASKPAADAAPAEKKKSNLPERPKYKYGVAELADKLGIEPASVRVALRKANVEKAPGGVYGWDTKTAFDEVVADLKPEKPEKKPTKKAA